MSNISRGIKKNNILAKLKAGEYMPFPSAAAIAYHSIASYLTI